jgi:hypothetical protein
MGVSYGPGPEMRTQITCADTTEKLNKTLG